MTRILLLIILVWVLYQTVKRIAASANTKPTQEGAEEKPEQKIVQCANCGCHVPESESQIKNNKIICNSPECNNTERNKP